LPVATLKQFATGNTRAQKPEMAQALARLLPASYNFAGDLIRKTEGALADHNEVDAIWLALYTQTVDHGERCFLGVYQRKCLQAAERRDRRAARKQKAKAKQVAAAAATKAKRMALKAAIKSLGRCGGVFRTAHGRRAICSKCCSKASIPNNALAADLAVHMEDSKGSSPNSIWNTPSVPHPGLVECPSNTKN
jgi:hypothetical protein